MVELQTGLDTISTSCVTALHRTFVYTPSNKLVLMMFIKLNVVSNEGLGSNTLQMLVIHFFSCVFAIAVVKNSNVFEIVLITLFLDLLILTHFYTAYGNK